MHVGERGYGAGQGDSRCPQPSADGLVMASVIEAFNYLVRGAPSTKAAVDKLAEDAADAVRAAGTPGETR